MDISKSKTEIDKIYAQLHPRADKLYQFVMVYSDYIHQARDYGTGHLINMVEVHTLTMIEDQPGITVSELAKQWRRTKSAVSQNVKKLEAKGFVYRIPDKTDAKIGHLYATEAGVTLSTAHKLFDNLDIMQTQNDLLKNCTPEEIDTFYKVLNFYSDLF